jgi:PPK2 family polyphosphate:nucleotide phosphotransferase
MTEQYRIPPQTAVDLNSLPTRGGEAANVDRHETEHAFKALRNELCDWQYKLYAEGKRKLLIVLQALDAGGKDGTIRNVFKGVNPQGVRVSSFKAPTKEELAHDFLWRIHQQTPANGMIRVFNRSHYEDVLIVRVQDIAPESVWRPRYDHINNFERLLVDSNTTILKFYLHISKDEQRQRLQDRINRPEKNWKFERGDLMQRAKWDAYQAAFEELFLRTSTAYAPWYVIPSDQKWYRNYAIMQILVAKLRELDPQFPAAEEGIAGMVIT